MAAVAPPFTVVGQPVPRVEGADKVTGRAKYSADIAPSNVLWAKNVRSPHPHARIVSIDASRALRVPGVHAVLTANDFPNQRIGRRLKDYPIICDDRVRFVGDKVAVVAADNPDAAEEAALLVAVEYEELPAVLDPAAAMEAGASIIHPDARSYVGFPEDIPSDIPNVCSYQLWERGEVEAGFAAADLVVEHTFSTQLMHQGYLEPHACVISLEVEGQGSPARIHVWASNKVPYNLRHELAGVLDCDEADILIHAVTVGADFGSKGAPGDVPVAYYLVRQTGRPVKFISSSPEDLISTSPRHPSVVTLKTGLRRDGTILARQARVIFNSGAYGAFKPSANGMLGGAGRAGGSYTIPNLRIDGFCVYTNQVPCGYMRAPGSPQVLFAVEAHTDLLARELGMDPLEFRLTNVPADSMAPQALRAAADAIGWGSRARGRGSERSTDSGLTPDSRPLAPLIGRGLSIADRGTGVGEGSCQVELSPDGTITALTAMPDNGTGGLTVVAQVVAEEFGVPLPRVRLTRGDTDALPIDVGSGASRMTNVAGHAAIQASEQLKQQLAPLAASMLGANSVEWERGGWRGPDGSFVSLEDLAAEMVKPGDPITRAQVTLTTPRSGDNAHCVQAAEVRVDPETGAVELLRMASAQDVGTIINAIGHQGQIEGALVQGIGFGLMEELASDDGHVTAGNLGEYKMPTSRDIPQLTTANIEATGPGPFAARAIGELPHIPTAGAIANAVADAIGAPIFELPITAERVLQAIDARRSDAGGPLIA
jgi:carbon-monoxide dehydrogenase large subunit